MKIDADRLKDGIKALKKGLNPEKCNRDYYIGFQCAMSTMEGLIAGMEQDYKKCRDCRFMGDKNKRDKRYNTCTCPDKEIRKSSSLLRYPWEKACKYFKEKEDEN